MKSKIILLCILTSVLISFSGCGLMSKKYTKFHTDNYTISTIDKKKLKLENVLGNIVIRRGRDSSSINIKATMEIRVKKKYLELPFDEIKINIDSAGSVLSLKAEIERNNDDGFLKFSRNKDAKVNYDITVPPGIEINIDNVSGYISTDNISNDLTIDLVNGDIDLNEYSGILDCEIVNGSFTADIKETKGIDINTVNGSVTLKINNFTNANVKAETVTGKITQENLQFREIDKEKKLFKGILGVGIPDVEIKIGTVNGKIKLIGKNEI